MSPSFPPDPDPQPSPLCYAKPINRASIPPLNPQSQYTAYTILDYVVDPIFLPICECPDVGYTDKPTHTHTYTHNRTTAWPTTAVCVCVCPYVCIYKCWGIILVENSTLPFIVLFLFLRVFPSSYPLCTLRLALSLSSLYFTLLPINPSPLFSFPSLGTICSFCESDRIATIGFFPMVATKTGHHLLFSPLPPAPLSHHTHVLSTIAKRPMGGAGERRQQIRVLHRVFNVENIEKRVAVVERHKKRNGAHTHTHQPTRTSIEAFVLCVGVREKEKDCCSVHWSNFSCKCAICQ